MSLTKVRPRTEPVRQGKLRSYGGGADHGLRPASSPWLRTCPVMIVVVSHEDVDFLPPAAPL
ncbi:hypothetical protein HanXRQr2_Chr12g0549671 [Helianthus annuus]|uniref:Uncharacterized protein n=1 Tax=Helianthus annuus TaxID=4232 RepID=A0A9K3MWS1_HELAN|nr:hypothetical protein HanXRQr2_Chr12g0549671 [Helianthus annuus]KAJ0494054.1 hypothetical protein HanIR_Chr12g0593031 [Helianthus annuus]KAJ0863371.1 hypothetical protein HanPSC8_Chr12g0529201 [Helianthus annuus]